MFGSFGAKPAAPAAGTTAAGGLFGGSSAQQQQPPASGGGLFGSATQPQQQAQQTGGGLFGSTTQPQQQQQAGGLFASTTQPAQQSGGLFGSAAQKPAGTGLFGSTTQPQQSTGGGLFGSTAPATQQPASTSVFGSAMQQQKPSTSLFGQSTVQPGGSSLFGQTTQPAQNQQQELKTSANPGTSTGADKTTKFSDLPEAAQRYIEQLEYVFLQRSPYAVLTGYSTAIKNQKSIASTLQTEPLGRAIWQTSLDVKSATEVRILIYVLFQLLLMLSIGI